MRVTHLVLGLDVGGLEMLVLGLARIGDRARVEHRVLCLGGRGVLADHFEAIGVAVEALGAQSQVQALSRLVARLRALRPHVLHTHNPRPHLLGSLARHFAGVPVLLHTKHGRNYPDQPRAVLANRLAAGLSDAVVAVSEDAAAVARTVERVASSKLRVIHNGVDLSRWPVPRWPVTPLARGVTLARLHPVKDHPTLLRALRRVVDVFPRFQLDLVGDGPERERLEALRDELGIRANVNLLGHRDDVQACLVQGGVFALSSLSEGISLTVLEAMAAGLPVVATDVGGNREIVVHGETGLLIPSRSPEALANALLTVLRDPVLALSMGRAGRRRVEEHFDLRRTAAAYEDLYVRLLAGREATGMLATPIGGDRGH